MTCGVTNNNKKINNQSNQPEQRQSPSEWHGRITSHLVGGAIIGLFVISAGTIYELAKHIAELVEDIIWRPDVPALEQGLHNKFEEKFISRLKSIPGLDYIRLFKHLAICSKDEEEIIKKLHSEFELSDDQIKEILGGAHVRIEDDGRIYQEWVDKMSSKQKRISSHPSNDAQYGIRGPFVKELLFSKIQDAEGREFTWFQLENHPVQFGHYIRHMLDYLRYKLSGKNQGPYGDSPSIDSKPLILKPRQNVEV